MSDNTNYLPIDQLPVDEHGLLIIPKGYLLWNEAMEENRKRVGSLLSNKVNVGKPEEYELPFIDGTTGYIMYNKTDIGLVTLEIALSADDREKGFPTKTEFAVLPIGFRPARKSLMIPMVMYKVNYEQEYAGGYLEICQDGTLLLDTYGGPNAIIWKGVFNFYAQ